MVRISHFENVHKQPFKLKHSFCLILKNKTKKGKSRKAAAFLSFFFLGNFGVSLKPFKSLLHSNTRVGKTLVL